MRKSLLQFAYVGAIALIGCVGFSSCSDEINAPGDQGGNIVEHVSDVGGVPVNFVFNVSTDAAPTTRMSAANTQTDNSFRGIDEAHLFSYQVAAIGDWVTTPTGYNKKFGYTSLMGAGTVTTSASKSILELSLPTNTNAMTFYGVALRNGTSAAQGALDKDFENLKFSYVQRTDDATYQKFQQAGGLITVSLTGMVDTGHKRGAFDIADREYYFWWDETNRVAVEVPYYDGTNGNSTSDYQLIYNSPGRLTNPTVAYDATSNPEQAGLPAVTYVARGYNDALESNDTGLSNTKVIGGNTYKLYHSTITWKQYGMWQKLNTDTDATNNVALLDIESDLGSIYNELTVIKPQELRASSSDAVLYMINDLMSSVTKLKGISPLSFKMQIAKRIAERIYYRITQYFEWTTNSKWEWRPLTKTDNTGLKDQINNVINTLYPDPSGPIDYYPLLTADADITGFPTITYGVPPGAALMQFSYETSATDPDDGGTFSLLINIPNYDLGGNGTTTVTVQNYVYPAELMYFGNSALRVSNKELNAATDFPNGAANWVTAANWDTSSSGDAWSDGADKITSETKSVAMMGNINYGVAVLETSVKLGTTTLTDNNGAINAGESDKTITVDDSSFELTGIIIGCQPTSVGWDYLPTSVTGTNNWDRLVYDNAIINQSVPQAGSVASYTLLLDNYCMGASLTTTDNDGGQEDQPAVYVALEFVNKASNFWGMHNLVRKNGKFYLIGKLDVSNGDTPTTYKTVPARTDGYAMPPYTNGHTSNNIARVFMQDYMTKATFVIGANSLKSAYVTVPNLQSSQLSLGLSVDVQWENGINFGEVTLGN